MKCYMKGRTLIGFGLLGQWVLNDHFAPGLNVFLLKGRGHFGHLVIPERTKRQKTQLPPSLEFSN